jgi:dihydrofolate reductase
MRCVEKGSYMRRIVTFNNVSADGYFTGPDGELDWIVPDEDIYKTSAERMADVDTILYGRRTYELFEGAWRHALDADPSTAPDPHDGGRRTRAMREQAIWINETKKVVFSKTLKNVTWRNSHLLHHLDTQEIEAMKKRPGKDMIVFGSGSIVSQLTQHGLIDEYQFIVGPTLLGSGRPLLGGVSKRSKLDLIEATKYRSGNVMLRYRRAS